MAKTSPKTKTQLVEENEQLREEKKNLKEKVSEYFSKRENNEYTRKVVVPFLDKEMKWKFVDVHFNEETGNAKVENIRNETANEVDYAVALMAAKKLLVDYMDREVDKNFK